MHFLAQFSIKTRIVSAFVVMQVILFAVAIISILALSNTRDEIEYVAGSVHPAAHLAGELEYQLEKANSALGFYLLSSEDVHKDRYLKSLAKIDETIERLNGLPLVNSDQDISEKVASIAAYVSKFKQFKSKILPLATNPLKNIPAQAAAAKNANPLSQQLLQLVSGMIQSESEEEPTAKRRKLLLNLGELRYARANITNGFRAFLAFRQKSSLDEIKLYTESMYKSLNKVKEQSDLLNLDQEDALQQFEGLAKKFDAALAEVVALHSSDKWRRDAYLIKTEIGPLLASYSSEVLELVKELRHRMHDSNEGLVAAVTSTTTLELVLLFTGLIFGTVISIVIVRGIVQPLRQALGAMEDIASGEGDLTRRLDDSGSDEVSQLAHGFNDFAGKVQAMVQQVAQYTGQLANEAERLTMVTRETSKGADRQQDEADQVATAMNEMAATVQEVARNAEGAAHSAQSADEAATDGRRVVGHTIDAIDMLAREIEKAGEVINRVEGESESIGGVLDVIKGIAEQTNLLALNAAIEAARAGEQGRGFAVVADEVRTLASRTQQSTAEIQTMIESLQSGARDAVDAMKDSRRQAQSSVEQAGKAGTSLESINSAVAEISALNSQIAGASIQQNSVAEDINRKIVSINAISEQTAAGAQQTASASNELNKVAAQLKSVVGQFKV